MKISLKIQGTDKTFVAPFISGRALRNTIQLMKNHNVDDLDVETLDIFVNHVVDLFGKQFTLDEFYDGMESTEMMPFIAGCMEGILRKTNTVIAPLQDSKNV